MAKIELNLGGDVKVRGTLYDKSDPNYLSEDMIEIDLPDGRTVEVGWLPDRDPSGSYRLTVFKDYWDDTFQVFLEDGRYVAELIDTFYIHSRDAVDDAPCLAGNILTGPLDLSSVVLQ
ncbi:MAG TPA: hypothetical protein VIK18_01335 [Pirellulales bacterium]